MEEVEKAPEEPSPDDKLLKIIMDAASRLSEHFDSVRIFCTKHGRGQTKNYTTGSGNYYAQVGQVREWVTIDEEYVRDNARHKE